MCENVIWDTGYFNTIKKLLEKKRHFRWSQNKFTKYQT